MSDDKYKDFIHALIDIKEPKLSDMNLDDFKNDLNKFLFTLLPSENECINPGSTGDNDRSDFMDSHMNKYPNSSNYFKEVLTANKPGRLPMWWSGFWVEHTDDATNPNPNIKILSELLGGYTTQDTDLYNDEILKNHKEVLQLKNRIDSEKDCKWPETSNLFGSLISKCYTEKATEDLISKSKSKNSPEIKVRYLYDKELVEVGNYFIVTELPHILKKINTSKITLQILDLRSPTSRKSEFENILRKKFDTNIQLDYKCLHNIDGTSNTRIFDEEIAPDKLVKIKQTVCKIHVNYAQAVLNKAEEVEVEAAEKTRAAELALAAAKSALDEAKKNLPPRKQQQQEEAIPPLDDQVRHAVAPLLGTRGGGRDTESRWKKKKTNKKKKTYKKKKNNKKKTNKKKTYKKKKTNKKKKSGKIVPHAIE